MKMLSRLALPFRLAAAISSVAVFAAAVSLKAQENPEDHVVIRISSNENAFGFSDKAKERMMDRLKNGNYYNHDEADVLAGMLAAKYGVQKDYIVTTAGSGPVLLMTAAAYGKPGINMVTADPGYPQLTNTFANFGGSVKYVPTNAKLGYDFVALSKAIDDKTTLVYICNPNNPTGVLADPSELRKFVLSVPPNILVFVDEAYLELSDSAFEINTMTSLVKVRKNLIVAHTFSKAYALAGFRVGYGVGHPETLAKIKLYYQGPPSFLAAIAAQESLKDKEHLEANRKKYHDVRQMVCKEFERLGLKYSEPQGAFIFFKTGIPAPEFQKKMRALNIMVTQPFGPAEGFADWARVSIGTQEEMEIFIGALHKVLNKT